MTAPERIWVYSTDGAYNGDCDVAQFEFHDSHSYTRTDIHQAALDRIAELEGALGEISEKDWGWGRSWVAEENGVKMPGQYAKIARAVLTKGDG